MSEDITLTQINPGEDADADVLMGNFNTLKNVLSSTSSRLNTVSNTATSALSGSLPKSGGTLTGNLIISKSSPYTYLKNTAQTAGTIPSSNQYERIYFQDKNGTTLGQVGNIYRTDGGRYSYITSAKGDGTGDAQIRVGYDASGNEFFSFPKCTTAATTTSTATSNLVAVIVKNYKSGASWYRIWSDGWIEQGGCVDKSSSGASSFTVSFLQSFANTNYFIAVTDRGNDNDTGGYDDQHVAVNGSSSSSYDFGLKKTGFRCSSRSDTHKFNWYACGY